MTEHSDAPWRFDAAPSDANMPDALRGHILPHGAGEDDPCVAYVENVGSVDLALMLAAPEMLAALEELLGSVDHAEDCNSNWEREDEMELASPERLAACDCPYRVAHTAIAKARGA